MCSREDAEGLGDDPCSVRGSSLGFLCVKHALSLLSLLSPKTFHLKKKNGCGSQTWFVWGGGWRRGLSGMEHVVFVLEQRPHTCKACASSLEPYLSPLAKILESLGCVSFFLLFV